jgi:hypothetical protein
MKGSRAKPGDPLRLHARLPRFAAGLHALLPLTQIDFALVIFPSMPAFWPQLARRTLLINSSAECSLCEIVRRRDGAGVSEPLRAERDLRSDGPVVATAGGDARRDKPRVGVLPILGLAVPRSSQEKVEAAPSAPASAGLRPGQVATLRRQAAVIRRTEAEAYAYIDDHHLGIPRNRKYVEAYINDRSNPAVHRRALRDEWNNGLYGGLYIEEPDDLAQIASRTRGRTVDHSDSSDDTPSNNNAASNSSASASNPYHFSQNDLYQRWTPSSKGESDEYFGGNINANHNRGAPKISSNVQDWPSTSVGDRYTDWVAAFEASDMDPREIAARLLKFDDRALEDQPNVQRAAAMLTATVYLAEEWRKQGAAKIYRAILRRIQRGERTFRDFLDDFAFVRSAQAGREQVARFYDVYLNDRPLSELSKQSQATYQDMSDIESEDFSSADEDRESGRKNLATVNRLKAVKHQQGRKRKRSQGRDKDERKRNDEDEEKK